MPSVKLQKYFVEFPPTFHRDGIEQIMTDVPFLVNCSFNTGTLRKQQHDI